jgi:16S rRNA (uracil1498-N3)-methyltransferase
LLLPGARQDLCPVVAGDRAALIVGPEGGLAESEIVQAAQAGFLAVRLGPRVLRTETAGLAALAALQATSGDMARADSPAATNGS